MIAAAQYPHDYAAFGGAFVQGGFSIVFSEIIIFATIATLMLSLGVGRDDQVAGTTSLVLWSASGAMLMAGAANLMIVFLGLELLSLALYCLCAISTRQTARESALKYLILSSMASGFLLYGSALLFGATGSVAFAALAAAPVTPLLALGAGLFLVGLAFKLSLVPFHAWTPDVYEGAPLPVTAFMSVVTKAGTLAVLARFAYAALPARPRLGDPAAAVGARRALDAGRQPRRARADRHEAAARVLGDRAGRLHRGGVRRNDARWGCATRCSTSPATRS